MSETGQPQANGKAENEEAPLEEGAATLAETQPEQRLQLPPDVQDLINALVAQRDQAMNTQLNLQTNLNRVNRMLAECQKAGELKDKEIARLMLENTKLQGVDAAEGKIIKKKTTPGRRARKPKTA